MFSVSINGRKIKRQLKVPKSPRLFYHPHPTKKKSTSKRAERIRGTRVGTGPDRAASPVQCVLRVREEKAPFCQKRSEKKWEGGKG